MEEIIQTLKQKAKESWPGAVGDERATRLETFLRKMLADYSLVMGIPPRDLLVAFENNRNYSAINFYQQANFPALAGVVLIENIDEFKRLYPSGRFRCPSCGGESTSPYECNTGLQVGEGKAQRVCDWKSYGLFGTMGMGMRIAFREGFLEHPKVEDIFMPVEAAK